VQDFFSCLASIPQFYSQFLENQYRLALEYLKLKAGFIFPSISMKHCYVFTSREFQTVYRKWVQRKSPLILKVVVAIAYVATILTSKIKMYIIGNESEVLRDSHSKQTRS